MAQLIACLSCKFIGRKTKRNCSVKTNYYCKRHGKYVDVFVDMCDSRTGKSVKITIKTGLEDWLL